MIKCILCQTKHVYVYVVKVIKNGTWNTRIASSFCPCVFKQVNAHGR